MKTTLTEAQAYKLHKDVAPKVAAYYGLDAEDLTRYGFAINKKENRQFNVKAKNPASTARGLMQMLVGTQREIETKILKIRHKPDAIYDALYAIYLGQIELARQVKRYNDWNKGIHAYNRGSYNPNSQGFKSGEAYRTDVLNNANRTNFAALESAIINNRT